jgi:hypothetical protein
MKRRILPLLLTMVALVACSKPYIRIAPCKVGEVLIANHTTGRWECSVVTKR